jgi:hypothetical protein
VGDEPYAHVIVSDGATPEVQENQPPFPLFGECLGEKAPDVAQILRISSVGRAGGQDASDRLHPGQHLLGHHGEEEIVFTREVGIDGTFRQAGGSGDLVQIRGIEAMLGEDF